MSWRPRNETALDRKRENYAKLAVQDAWNCKCSKLSETLYGIDWAISRDEELLAWGEYKWRDKRFETLLLSFGKWASGIRWCEMSGKPFFLFVEWPDGLHWCKASDLDLPIRIAGSNRGQNGDKEPCVFIDTSLFAKIPQAANVNPGQLKELINKLASI